MFLANDERAVIHLWRFGRTETDRDEILAHQSGELDQRFAVGLHVLRFIQFHRHLDGVLHQIDFLDPADLHAGHLDRVAFLEFLDGFEPGMNANAMFEDVKAADRFHNENRGDEREGEKDSQPGFERVFHKDFLCLCFLKSAVKNCCILGCGLLRTCSGFPTIRIWPSAIRAIRSAMPKARSRSWVTTKEVT